MFNSQIAEAFPGDVPEGAWLIVDKGAKPDTYDHSTGATIKGERRHDITYDGAIRAVIFKNGQALPLPEELAVKLLKADNFARVNEKGEELDWKNPPKQPDELGAGEKLALADHETIADLSELTLEALKIRAMREKGGEKLKNSGKEAVILFLVSIAKLKREQNMGRDLTQTGDMYDPDPDVFEE